MNNKLINYNKQIFIKPVASQFSSWCSANNQNNKTRSREKGKER